MSSDEGNKESANGHGLRQRQVAETEQAIIEAFLDLAHAENAINISMPAVARRSGVSVRTVYRYFPTKDALQSAAALRFDEQARQAMHDVRIDVNSFAQYLTQLWTTFAGELPAVLAEHASPVGRELRQTRLPSARRAVRTGVPALADDERTVDMLVAVTSSSMFIELVVRMGYSPEEAASIAVDLAWLVIDSKAGPISDLSAATPEEGVL